MGTHKGWALCRTRCSNWNEPNDVDLGHEDLTKILTSLSQKTEQLRKNQSRALMDRIYMQEDLENASRPLKIVFLWAGGGGGGGGGMSHFRTGPRRNDCLLGTLQSVITGWS